MACITLALAIEGWQTTSFHHCTTDAAFSSKGNVIDVHVQVDLANRGKERTGSYPDGRDNGRSGQLEHFVVI